MRQRTLPPLPAAYLDPLFRVGVDGRLLALASTFDLSEARERADWQPGERNPPLPEEARSAVFALCEGHWREVATFACRAYHYDFDVGSDDWCIVAEPRCRPGQNNALTFANGEPLTRYCIGDGIQHIQCDDQDGFWVGYFDEGIFGNFGWGHAPGELKPMGACGLHRFSRAGESTTKYPGELGDIADCYAMNVVGGTAWICPYSEFPIEALAIDGAYHHWSNNSVAGATALAVDGKHVALIGGYRGDWRRVVLMTLREGETSVIKITSVQHLFPRVDLSRFRLLARGANIHLVDRLDWLTLAIGDIV